MGRFLSVVLVLLYLAEVSLQLVVTIIFSQEAGALHVVFVMMGLILITTSAITNVFSITRVYRKLDFSEKSAGNIVCVLMHLCQLSVVWRFIVILAHNRQSDVRTLLLIRIIQSNTQSLPFAVVHGFALLYSGVTPNPVHVSCVTVSIVSASLAQVTYERYTSDAAAAAASQPLKGVCCAVLIYLLMAVLTLFTLSNRVLSFALFIQVCGLWILLALGGHIAIYGFLAALLRRLSKERSYPRSVLESVFVFINIFAYLKIEGAVSKWELWAFYSTFTVENIVMTVVWHVLDTNTQLKPYILAASLSTLVLGIVFLLLFTRCLLSGRHETKPRETAYFPDDTVSGASVSTVSHRVGMSMEYNKTRSTSKPRATLSTKVTNVHTASDSEVTMQQSIARPCKVKNRSLSFSRALGLITPVTLEKEFNIHPTDVHHRHSDCETPVIDLQLSEDKVDECWLNRHSRKWEQLQPACYNELQRGFVNVSDAVAESRVVKQTTIELTPCKGTSSKSDDHGYFSRGEKTSSSSCNSSHKEIHDTDTLTYGEFDIHHQTVLKKSSGRLLDPINDILNTASALKRPDPNDTSSWTCSVERTSQSSIPATESDDSACGERQKARTPLHWKTLPPARSKEWRRLVRGATRGNATREVVTLAAKGQPTTVIRGEREWTQQQATDHWYAESSAGSSDCTFHDPRDRERLRDEIDSTSFCTTCDELYNTEFSGDDSESGFTQTWPPNHFNTRAIRRIPEDGVSREERIVHWLQGVSKLKGGDSSTVQSGQVLGRRHDCSTNGEGRSHQPIPIGKSQAIGANVNSKGKHKSSKTLFASLCTIKRKLPPKLYPHTLSGSKNVQSKNVLSMSTKV